MRALIANRFTVGVDARCEMILVGCGGVRFWWGTVLSQPIFRHYGVSVLAAIGVSPAMKLTQFTTLREPPKSLQTTFTSRFYQLLNCAAVSHLFSYSPHTNPPDDSPRPQCPFPKDPPQRPLPIHPSATLRHRSHTQVRPYLDLYWSTRLLECPAEDGGDGSAAFPRFGRGGQVTTPLNSPFISSS